MLSFIRQLKVPSLPADLPLCELPVQLDLSTAKRVLVFAPHPDDEVLGCGGTLAQLAMTCQVRVVLVTDGSGAGALPPEAGAQRRQEWVVSLASLGIEDVVFMNLPDGDVWPGEDLQNRISEQIEAFCPNWVFGPAMTDYHRDHMAIARTVYLACRQNPAVEQLLSYEIWAPAWATHVVDITAQVALKRAALLLQKTSMQYGNYLQAIEGLNLYRGLYLGRMGASAEAFAVECFGRGPQRMATPKLWLRWLRFTSN